MNNELKQIWESISIIRDLIKKLQKHNSNSFYKKKYDAEISKLNRNYKFFKAELPEFPKPSLTANLIRLNSLIKILFSKKPHKLKLNTIKQLERFWPDLEIDLEKIVQKQSIPILKDLNLHPKIVSASQKLFQDRHYSQAIFEAMKSLEKEIKSKSNIRDKIGVDLVNHVFNKDHPIIKIVEGEESEQKDEREGFRFLYMGAFLGIKNPKSHSIQNLNDPDKALEYLSFLSLLLKRLDESTT